MKATPCLSWDGTLSSHPPSLPGLQHAAFLSGQTLRGTSQAVWQPGHQPRSWAAGHTYPRPYLIFLTSGGGVTLSGTFSNGTSQNQSTPRHGIPTLGDCQVQSRDPAASRLGQDRPPQKRAARLVCLRTATSPRMAMVTATTSIIHCTVTYWASLTLYTWEG